MKKLITVFILCISISFLGACTAKPTETAVPEATEVAVVQATPTVVVPATAEPELDNCVVCHTDQQMLTDTAMVVEEDTHGSESEGVG